MRHSSESGAANGFWREKFGVPRRKWKSELHGQRFFSHSKTHPQRASSRMRITWSCSSSWAAAASVKTENSTVIVALGFFSVWEILQNGFLTKALNNHHWIQIISPTLFKAASHLTVKKEKSFPYGCFSFNSNKENTFPTQREVFIVWNFPEMPPFLPKCNSSTEPGKGLREEGQE